MTTNIYVCAILIFAGMVAHGLKKLYDLERAGTVLSPMAYWRKSPYGIALAVVSTYLLGAFWYYIGQLNEVTAILTGVACGSAFDTLRARAAGKLRTAERD